MLYHKSSRVDAIQRILPYFSKNPDVSFAQKAPPGLKSGLNSFHLEVKDSLFSDSIQRHQAIKNIQPGNFSTTYFSFGVSFSLSNSFLVVVN